MSRADLESPAPSDSPSRLIDASDSVAAGLRALDARTRPDGQDEAAAWRRLAGRLPVTGARRWFWSGAFVTAGVALVVLVGRQPSAPITSGAVGTPSAPPPAAGTAHEPRIAQPLEQDVEQNVEPPAPRVALSPRPIALAPGRAALAPGRVALAPGRAALAPGRGALAPGRLALPDEATVDLAEGSTARASADAAWVRVLLDEGEVGLHVAKRVPGGPGFEVVAGAYHFRVLGTRFRVARGAHGGPPVELWVEEGRVAVSRDGRALGVVAAGGHWDAREAHAGPRETPTGTERSRRRRHAFASSRVAAATHASPIAQERPSGLSPPATCAALAANAATARDAVACYLPVARGDDLAAETALFEIARLRRDVLGEGAGALAALQESRTRFPTGTLREEVDLSIVELLPKLNRHNEAIEEIGRLLADGHGTERTAELRVMRGNIYREVLEDYGHAERDYAAAEEARAPTVGDATFFRGVCLQALGRAKQARATFERYLAAGAARYADEAHRRLQRLGH